MVAFQVVAGSREHTANAPAFGLDWMVDATNLTQRLPRAGLAPLLRDAAHELAELLTDRRRRVAVRCPNGDEAWELGLERVGELVLVSLFRGGPELEIAYLDRGFEHQKLVASLIDALTRAEQVAASKTMCRELQVARITLAGTGWLDSDGPSEPTLVQVEPDGAGPLCLSAEVLLRQASRRGNAEPKVDRADLFSLLQRGTLRVTVGGRTRVFSGAFVFIIAERLLSVASELLLAWEQGRPFFQRIEVFGFVFGLRLATGADAKREQEGSVWLTVGERRGVAGSEPWTFRLPDASSVIDAIVGFGRTLARSLLRHDPDQRRNLRLSALRQALRDLGDRLEESTENGAKINDTPERYRAFVSPALAPSPPSPPTRLRYSPGWTAMVPGIDLRSTFLCGEHLVIGGARETAVVERQSGSFLWRQPTPPAVSVVTSLGLARLFADGSIALLDFETGETKLTTRVTPRVGGPMMGAVIGAAGLPKLLVVTEGDRYLSALDLRSGETQWRHAARVGKTFRLRRAGKLLIVAAGDATLSALDVASGEVVWRICDRLRFTLQVGLDSESVFAIAGDPEPKARGVARLYHIDPYAGVVRWARDLPPGATPFGAPLVADREALVVTRDRRGLGLVCFDRQSGDIKWTAEPGLAPASSAWLTIDDQVVFNSESGALIAIQSSTGQIKWRHAFPRGMEGDQPRRLEPILRSGALFVPQQQVHVVRPRDGAIIGCVPTDLIPDLLRVDERCDVYLAEDSGHLASFRAGPKLRLVEA